LLVILLVVQQEHDVLEPCELVQLRVLRDVAVEL
jgi:hypothetical protein